MNKGNLEKEVFRLMRCDNLGDCRDMLNIFLEYFFRVIRNNDKVGGSTSMYKDARMVNQMIFSKVAHLKEFLNGIEYQATDGMRLNRIIDPTLLAILVRNIFETIGMFNVVYVKPKSNDEKSILYNLWVLAGLNYRQRFATESMTEDAKRKVAHEIEQIKTFKERITDTKLYKSLSLKDQGKILTKIKEKDYKIYFENNEVHFLTWSDITKIMNIKDKITDEMYTYFSLYAHPSNVSVFQFANLFKASEEHFVNMTIFNLKYSFFLISTFIDDYRNLFPEIMQTFETLSIRDKMVLHNLNVISRAT
ncbi:hypothetical protein [Mucilaginibacter sp. NFR10]|uniref:hypothetical protein n=1 Tax=Mucilaginibacter sp. NFR10 TaxID=1566292 RepID=UPI000871B2C8|nr:hypothetical protein [Mucilaginibacter sp. NFR10]SCW55378.1 hypothetical protein SAMN03159284_01784 [Mucilaginibacter sp. NFR10]